MKRVGLSLVPVRGGSPDPPREDAGGSANQQQQARRHHTECARVVMRIFFLN
jgi:hypothetical protein